MKLKKLMVGTTPDNRGIFIVDNYLVAPSPGKTGARTENSDRRKSCEMQGGFFGKYSRSSTTAAVIVSNREPPTVYSHTLSSSMLILKSRSDLWWWGIISDDASRIEHF